MADALDCDILPKDQLGGGPLGVLTKGLLLLWQSTPLSDREGMRNEMTTTEKSFP